MGDRANIFIPEPQPSHPNQGVWLYAHWRGYDMALVVKEALAQRQRWDDPQYLSRILFQALIDGDTGVTGYGISARMHDNERPVLIVNTTKQEVGVAGKGRRYNDPEVTVAADRVLPFAKFIAMTDDEVREWHLGSD